MAKIVQANYDIKVATWADLLAIPNPKDGMQVTVIDATGDPRTLGGTVLYQYLIDYAGTPQAWMIVKKAKEETQQIVQESLLISSGKVTLSDFPNGNIIFDVQVKWEDNGQVFVEDVAYAISGKDVFVSAYYDGKYLDVKYMKNNSGTLYQIGEGSGGLVDWGDIQNKPTSLSGYGILDGVKWSGSSGIDIFPKIADQSNLGSGFSRFNGIYTNTLDATNINIGGKAFVEKVEEIIANNPGGAVDLTNYYTKDEVKAKIDEAFAISMVL